MARPTHDTDVLRLLLVPRSPIAEEALRFQNNNFQLGSQALQLPATVWAALGEQVESATILCWRANDQLRNKSLGLVIGRGSNADIQISNMLMQFQQMAVQYDATQRAFIFRNLSNHGTWVSASDEAQKLPRNGYRVSSGQHVKISFAGYCLSVLTLPLCPQIELPRQPSSINPQPIHFFRSYQGQSISFHFYPQYRKWTINVTQCARIVFKVEKQSLPEEKGINFIAEEAIEWACARNRGDLGNFLRESCKQMEVDIRQESDLSAREQ